MILVIGYFTIEDLCGVRFEYVVSLLITGRCPVNLLRVFAKFT